MTPYNLLRNTTQPTLQPTETITAYKLNLQRSTSADCKIGQDYKASLIGVRPPSRGNDGRMIGKGREEKKDKL